MKNQEILAAIAAIENQLSELKAMVMASEEEPVVEVVEELPAPPAVVVIPELVEEPKEAVVVKNNDFSEEIRMANALILKTGLIDTLPGSCKIDTVDIHLKVLKPKIDGKKPYVLYKQGIFEVDAYDIDSNLLGTSKQFKLDFLGSELAMYLRARNVWSYKKNTYEPIHCWLCCND